MTMRAIVDFITTFLLDAATTYYSGLDEITG
jgi:hypothetical protein